MKDTIPAQLPDLGDAAFFCVLDDGETYGGAINARISIWNDQLVDEAFGIDGDIHDFSDAYENIPEGTAQPLDIPLSAIIHFFQEPENWRNFVNFCEKKGCDWLKTDEEINAELNDD